MASEGKVETLRQVLDGFHKHDLDAIMSHSPRTAYLTRPAGPTAAGAAFPVRTRCAAGWPRTCRAFPMFMVLPSRAGDQDLLPMPVERARGPGLWAGARVARRRGTDLP